MSEGIKNTYQSSNAEYKPMDMGSLKNSNERHGLPGNRGLDTASEGGRTASIHETSGYIWRTESLCKHFLAKRHFFDRSPQVVRALEQVSLYQKVGETLGIVGESGCGKSTFGRTLMGLYPKSSGRIWVKDREIMSEDDGRFVLQHIQMVFQDPYASLNPRMTVRQILREPLTVQGAWSRAEQNELVEAVLHEVGLSKSQGERYAHEFSGGQRQRIGIGRALISNPECIICDEPISALDVSIQVQIIKLLARLQEEKQVGYVFISHDLNMVRYMSQRIAVMYLGHVVEEGTTQAVYENPLHPYTQALIRLNAPLAAPMTIGPVLEGEVPSPLDEVVGCPFAPRCPEAQPICKEKSPSLTLKGPQRVACWQR
ncbi:ABC transporter ATP-binding protein [uncultured Veillonella sp.]|uniref:ABC transporter ATP-binding protein n=1 Tax=uncultured Veillonella sp. TaxID=159268 RepID=UPI00261A631E|nr:oligopeptide/dipeptide ABC transporter ATP-binding protein [uncultured Veillonella sp.]